MYRVDMGDYFEEGALVGVLTPEPIDRVLDYRAPEGGCWLGAFVDVPLGPRKVLGVVWGAGKGDYDLSKIRAVNRVLDAAPMRAEMRDFLTKAGAYTLTPMSQMLRLATRVPGLSDPPSMRKVYRLGQGEPDRMTPARRKVIETLVEYGGLGFTLSELSSLAGVSTSVIKGLAAQGVVEEADTPRDTPYLPLDPDRPGKDLAEDQAAAAEVLRGAIRTGAYGTTLLKGVTGSGKTEVYLEAVAECLRKGRQALVLLPEIALTAEFLTRVEARFGAKPAEWHSGVTLTERRRCWKMLGQGEAQLVVGARSALFLPFRDLGLIVVDEEHDSSYKQEEGALYNARDMAVLRASLNEAQVVLASATPSLETWANAEAGKYARLDLTSRFGRRSCPRWRRSTCGWRTCRRNRGFRRRWSRRSRRGCRRGNRRSCSSTAGAMRR
jgi:primosomal protein N' (replication factor Y)